MGKETGRWISAADKTGNSLETAEKKGTLKKGYGFSK